MHLEPSFREGKLFRVIAPVALIVIAVLITWIVVLGRRPQKQTTRQTVTEPSWSQRQQERQRELDEVLNQVYVAANSDVSAILPDDVMRTLEAYFPKGQTQAPTTEIGAAMDRMVYAHQILARVIELRKGGLVVLPPMVDRRVDDYMHRYPHPSHGM